MKLNKIVGGALMALPISAILVASCNVGWKFVVFATCLMSVTLVIVFIGMKIYYWDES